MAFNGCLIYGKCVNAVTIDGTSYAADDWIPFPHGYILADSYIVGPDKKTELKAYRDNNINLHRVTGPNDKSTVDFTTRVLFDTPDLQKIRTWLYACVYNSRENKLDLKIWKPNTGAYSEIGASYKADTDYPISTITASNIKYNEISWSFVQY